MSTKVLPLLPWNAYYISSERVSLALCRCALARALDLMIIGHVEQANRIVTTLHHHDALQFENDLDTLQGMCFAWAHTNLWPSFILEPDPARPKFRRGRFLTHLGHLNPHNVESVIKELDMEERQRWSPQSNNHHSKSRLRHVASLLNEMDDALKQENLDECRELVRKHVVSEFKCLSTDSNTYNDRYCAGDYGRDTKRKALTNLRSIWTVFCDGTVAQELGLRDSSTDIVDYTDRGIESLERRFTNGRARQYGDMSIAKIVEHLDKDSIFLHHSYLNVDDSDETDASDDGHDRKSLSTYTHSPATEDEIRELETRLGITLPEDYKTYLHTTSFFGGHPNDPMNILNSPAYVGWDEAAIEISEELDVFFLMPYESTSIDLMGAFKRSEDMNAIYIGAGADQGFVWMLPRAELEKALKAFESVYETSPKSDQKVFERAARDLYGGLEEMRKLEWLVVCWSEGTELFAFKGFRGYLEYLTESQAQYRALEERQGQRKQKQAVGEGRTEGNKRKRADSESDITDDENASNTPEKNAEGIDDDKVKSQQSETPNHHD